MSGFWTKKETRSIARKDGKTYSCISCQLYKNCEHPKLEAEGRFNKKILNVFPYPSTLEDQRGRFIGDLTLKKMFHSKGISLEQDCLNTYAMKCAPVDKDEEKLNYEMDCCRIHLMRLIKKHKPKVINLFGKHALYALLGNRWKGGLDSIDKWRGFVIPDQDMKCWIAPFYSLDYLKEKEYLMPLFKMDIHRMVIAKSEEFPIYKPPNITVLKSLKPLKKINGGVIAFDYETTGLKPHAKGHRIVCASVAVNEDDVFVFMMPKNKEDRKPFVSLLKNPNVKKMAHNMKFEQSWSIIRLGTKVNKWHWDSMIAAHILDNRTGITGLKFQTYVQFGVMDYSSEVSPHLKGKEKKNANSMNKLMKFVSKPKGREMVLEYCALDSIFEYRLAVLQQEMIKNILPF